MQTFVIISAVIFVARIFQDVFFLMKIDAFNRGNRIYLIIVNFVESIYAILVIKYVIEFLDQSLLYGIIFGIGSSVGGIIIQKLKKNLDNKLEGQREYYARISVDDYPSDLIDELEKNDFELSVEERKYINKRSKFIIEGSLGNRKRKDLLKSILRGRENKHVIIMRAEEVYFVQRKTI